MRDEGAEYAARGGGQGQGASRRGGGEGERTTLADASADCRPF